MAYNFNAATLTQGDGSNKTFSIDFTYSDPAHVHAYVERVEAPITSLSTTSVTLQTAPPAGALVFIRRETPNASKPVTFAAGMFYDPLALEVDSLYHFHRDQEIADEAEYQHYDTDKKTTAALNATAEALAARDAAVESGNDAVAAGNAAVSAKDAAVSAKDTAVSAKDAAALSAADALSARNASQTAQTVTEIARDVGIAARDAALASKNASKASETASKASETNAAGSASTATTKAGEAATSATSAAGSAATATTKASEAAQSVASLNLPARIGTTGPASCRNKIRNPRFSINQRAVSGTVTLAAGAFGHDGWKAGAGGCTYTFSTSQGRTTLTITAGSLIQTVDGLDLAAGANTHTLSWGGTCQGKRGTGSYGPTGVAGLATGGTNIDVEFGTGTLYEPQFEIGTVASEFDYLPEAFEAERCQRYLPGLSGFGCPIGVGQAVSTADLMLSILFKTGARVAPTGIYLSEPTHIRVRSSGASTQNPTAVAFNAGGTGGLTVMINGLVGLTSGHASVVYSNSADFKLLAMGCEL